MLAKWYPPPYLLLSVTLVSHELAKVSGTEGHGCGHAQNMHEQVGCEIWKFTRTKNKIRSNCFLKHFKLFFFRLKT